MLAARRPTVAQESNRVVDDTADVDNVYQHTLLPSRRLGHELRMGNIPDPRASVPHESRLSLQRKPVYTSAREKAYPHQGAIPTWT